MYISILEYVYEYIGVNMSILEYVYEYIGVCLLVYWSMFMSILEYK